MKPASKISKLLGSPWAFIKLMNTQFLGRNAQYAAFLKVIWPENTPLNFSSLGRGGGRGTPLGVPHFGKHFGKHWVGWKFLQLHFRPGGSWSTREPRFTRESHETRLFRASSILGCSQHRFNSGSQTLRAVLGYKDEWPRLERAYAVRGVGARWCWDEFCSGNRRKSTFSWAGRGWGRARGIQILLVRLHETYKTYTSCPEVNRNKELVQLSRWCCGVVSTVVEGHKQGPYSDGLNCCVTAWCIYSVFYKVGHSHGGSPHPIYTCC